ncbi:endonuclease domain-containing protein [Carboxylicivirga marina]|uniref:endonuclease domain-containing protein n=1 Tax=Carboxylicivirga marina TaxID=2800988 RepID=UPI0025944BF9|nr:DUF559 domain-containing protein [uncultured Carboxylicivirga sp.]
MEIASKHNNWHYNPYLTERAKRLRRNFTKSESYLWKFALKKSIMGIKFLRQRPVLNYIADFMSRELRLIIECDGASHMIDGAEERDIMRDQALENVGFKVLRFSDDMVLDNLSLTLSIIEEVVTERKEELGV